MSYNDPIDVEAVLQVPPAPPAATPSLRRERAPFPIPADPLPNAVALPPTPVAVPLPIGGCGGVASVPQSTALSTLPPVQAPPPPRSASVQLVPVPPPLTPTISALLQTPLVVNGQNSTPQTPGTTTPGTTTQS